MSDLAVSNAAELAVVDDELVALLGAAEGSIIQTDTFPYLPRVSLMQAMSQDVAAAGKTRAGTWKVDLMNGADDPIYFDAIHIWHIDSIMGRVAYPFTADGKKVQGEGPLCSSADSIVPRSFFTSQEVEIQDWRVHSNGVKPVVKIVEGHKCAECPLQHGFSAKDETTGKNVFMPPPCQLSPAFIVFLFEINGPAIIQSAAPTIREVLLGAKKKKLPGIGKYFEREARRFVDEQGRLRPLRVGSKSVQQKNRSWTFVPELEWGDTPLTVEQQTELLKQINWYREQNIRDILSAKTYNPTSIFDEDEGEDEVPSTGVTVNGDVLGAGKDRRIGENPDVENPF